MYSGTPYKIVDISENSHKWDGEILRRIIASSKITRRFQITLPKDVRERFKFEEGDLVLFVVEDGKLLLEKG